MREWYGYFEAIVNMDVNDSAIITQEELRNKLNFLLLDRRMQTLVLTAVILAVGVVGNLLVLAAYWNLLHKRKTKELKGRYFMPVLAIADLASVFVGGVFFLYTDFHRATFDSDFGCKFGMFFSFNTNTISILILLLITISRYMKICLPHGRRMTVYWKKVSLAIVTVVSTVSCSPFLHFSGTVKKSIVLQKLSPILNIPQDYFLYNVTYTMCFATTRNDILWKLYYSFLFLIQIANMMGMIILYVRMGRVIYNRCNFNVSAKLSTVPNAINNENDRKLSQSDSDSGDENDDDTQDGGTATVTESTVQSVATTIDASNDTATKTRVVRRSKRGRKHAGWKNARNRFSVMFLIIVIIYAITNIPAFVFLYLFMENETFRLYFTMRSDFEVHNLILCFVRVHLINNIVNPFIYGYFDLTFRKEVKVLCYSVIVKPVRVIWARDRSATVVNKRVSV